MSWYYTALSKDERIILQYIIDNDLVFTTKIAKELKYTQSYVGRVVRTLVSLNYIELVEINRYDVDMRKKYYQETYAGLQAVAIEA